MNWIELHYQIKKSQDCGFAEGVAVSQHSSVIDTTQPIWKPARFLRALLSQLWDDRERLMSTICIPDEKGHFGSDRGCLVSYSIFIYKQKTDNRTEHWETLTASN